MLSILFSNIRRTRFDQSSPVHPVSESMGGTLSVTDEVWRTEILVSNCRWWLKRLMDKAILKRKNTDHNKRYCFQITSCCGLPKNGKNSL